MSSNHPLLSRNNDGGGETQNAEAGLGSQQQQQHSADLLVPSVVSERKSRVHYDTNNTFGVLSQMQGSVWPKVLPYCVANTALTFVVYYLKHEKGIDLTFSDKGHTFMSMMVSFLVVTRSNIAYARYWEARTELSKAMKSCRELIQHSITFSRYDLTARAQQWRSDVARRTVVLLRVVVSVLEYQTSGQHAWKIPELTKDEKQALLDSVGRSNERTPMVLIMFLRSTIASHVEYLEKPFHVNKELRLLKFISDFVTAYHGLMKLVTTPFPFPLVQMARTFVLVWIFTLPFSLVYDMQTLPALLFLVFFVTFGFVGLEFVSIEFDDPFGDDPNDFDVLGLARVVFEDIYISLYDIDGKVAAENLRRCVEAPLEQQHQDPLTAKSTSVTDNTLVPSHGNGRHRRYDSIDAFNNSAAVPKNSVGAERSYLLSDASRRAFTPTNGGDTVSEASSHGGSSLDLAAVFDGDCSPSAFGFDSPYSNASSGGTSTPTPTYGATASRQRTFSREGKPPRPQDYIKK